MIHLLEFESFAINEGGKALTSVRPVTKEEAEKTLDDLKNNLIPKLGLDWDKNVIQLGTAGHKEKSNDIDLGIYGRDLESLSKEIKDYSDEIVYMKGLEVLSFAWPIVGADGDHVQVDMIPVVDKKWTDFIYGNPEGSQYKSAHRNWMFAAILSPIHDDKKDDGKEYTAYVFKLNNGLFKTKKSFVGKTKVLKKAGKVSEELITMDPTKFVHFLFGDKYGPNDVKTFEDVWHIMNQSDFKWKANLEEIKKEYAMFLKRASLPLPKEIV